MTAGINLTNQFLIAMPGMVDETFAGAVVYLCEHNENGALGLVINKPIDITLKNLFEKVELALDRDELARQPVFFGGPVQTERGFVLHEQAGRGTPYSSTLSDPRRPGDDDQQGRAGGAVRRRRPEAAAGHAGLQRLVAPASSRTRSAATAGSPWTPTRRSSSTPRSSSATSAALALLGVDPRMLSQEAGHA